MKLTEEHIQLRDTLRKFIDREINPYVEEWEAATRRCSANARPMPMRVPLDWR